jgi:gliding motility-associated-like protein
LSGQTICSAFFIQGNFAAVIFSPINQGFILSMKKRTLTFLLLLCSTIIFSQVITPFSIRYQVTQKGGIRYISNTATTCSGSGCGAGRVEVPPAGTSTDNGFTAAYVDIDADGTTFQSSSDSIALPTCSQVSWAGLYWGGEMDNTGANYATRNQCKIKTNTGAYVSLTADQLQDNAVGFSTYHCFKDITTIVQAGGTNARYTVANVAARVGGTNRFGGWTIVVVYKNDLQPMRNLTVFNGLSNVSGSNPTTDITVSGFLTPLSGPVTFEVGDVTYDGDRSSTGDQLMFNGGSGFVNISDAVNPTNDIFNSTYSYNGVQKVTPFINPGYTNSLGYDADIFIPNNVAKNYIGNSATSATLRLTTGGETFLTQVVTMAIDVYEPDLRAACRVVDLNGGVVLPGDILEYTIVGKNIGSDPSVNTYLTDTLEHNAIYIPGSLQVTYGPNTGAKTDATGDDQGEYFAATNTIKVRVGTGANSVTGGQMNNSTLGIDSTQIKFRATATTDCVVLQCDNIINNRAYIFGTGNVSGNNWNNGSNPDIFDGSGCPVPGTTNTPISAASCSPPAAGSNSPVCTGNTISLSTTPASSIATYSWSGPGGFTSTAANPTRTNATAAMAGTYTCVITVPSSTCSYTVTTTVVVNTTPATPSPSSNTPVCTGNTINLSTAAVAGATYSWTGPSAFSSALQNPTRAGATLAMAGTYSVTVTTNGCTSAVGTTAVVVNTTPATPSPSSNTPVCTGNTINLSTAAVAGATYSWTGPSAFASALQNPTRAGATLAMAGTYSVTVTTNGCTSAVGTTTVVVNSTPATPAPSSNSPVCSGNTINLSTAAVAGATYSWTGPNTFSSSVQNPAITNSTTAMAGTYSVTVTTNGCTSAVGTTAVVVNSTPATPAPSSNSPVCTGNSINLSTAAVAGATYSWTGPNTFSSAVQNPAITNATTAMAGTYSVTVTTSGCTSAVGTTAVVVNTTPATPSPSSNTPVCTGNTINLSTAAVAGATYSWTGPNTFSSSVQNPAIINATTAMAGTYSLTVTTNGCTSAVGTTAVVVNTTPATPAPSDNTPVCTGNSINLFTAAVAGATYSWTGPNTFSSSVQNPTIASATTAMAGTYSVTVTTNGCTSAAGTTVMVVNTTPATPAPSSNTPVCTGNTINLSTSAVAGATYSWTGPNTFSSSVQNPAITNATTAMAGTYSLTVTTNGCTSGVGTTALVVNTTPSTPSPSSNTPVCTGNTINLSTAAVAGATYSWTGPSAFASALQNPTRSAATVAMAGTYSLTVTTNGCTSAVGTTVVVVNTTPSTPSPSSNTPVCTGNTINLSTTAVAGATYSWTGPNTFSSSVQNPSIANATTAMAGTYSLTVTTTGCTSAAGTTSVVVNTTPATPTPSSNTPVCTGNTINLFTAAVAGATYSWTGPNTFSSSVQNPSIASATTAMAGTYSLTVTTSGCTSAVGSTALVVNTTPSVPAPSSNSPVCNGSTINLSTTAVAGATYSWTGPNAFSSSVQNPSIASATSAMAGTYSLTITTNGCTSGVGTTAVVVNNPPTVSNAGSAQAICGTSTTMAGNAPASGTGVWTEFSGPNIATIVTASSPTTTINGMIAGTYVFQWTISNSPCTASSSQVTVVVSDAPTTADAGTDQTVCSSAGNTTMSGNTPSLGTGAWSQISGPSTATITSAASPTTAITGLTTAGTYVFQWTISNGSCAPSTDQVNIVVNDPPTIAIAGTSQSLCGIYSATMSANAATTGTGNWTQVSGPNTATITSPSSETTTMTGLVAGTYIFQWTISNAPCAASSDQVQIDIYDAPTIADAGTDQMVCSSAANTTMAGNIPSTGTGMWSQVSGPSAATITSPSSPSTTITGLTSAGTYTFQWSISNGTCTASTDLVDIVVNDPPAIAAAGADQSLCAASTATMAANIATTGAGLWTQISGPNTATIITPSSETTTINGLVAGTYIFQWKISNAPCAADSDQVQVDIFDAPTTSDAGLDQSICSTTGTVTMAGNIPSTGTGMWSQVSGPSTATITTPSSETTTITALTTAGIYIFQWDISNGVCSPSTDQVQVTVSDPPTSSNAGADQSLCSVTTTTMTANAATTGTGNWTQVSGPNAATITTPSSETTTMTGLVAGTYTFAWTISNGACTASSDTMQLTIFDLPTTANAGTDQQLCNATSATMAANAATTGTGMWSQSSGPSAATIVSPSSETTTINGLQPGTYVFVWSITNGVCAPSTDSVSVVIDPLPTIANAGADMLNACPPVITMAANTATSGTGMWSQVSGPNTATITTPSSETTTINGLTAGSYIFVWTISSGTCSASSDTINVTVVNCDSDGDGVPDNVEISDNTDPNDPCNYLASSISLPQFGNWNLADCDGDGVTNGTEITDGTNPTDPCDYTAANITVTPNASWNALDCDGDGVINGTEITDGTNPVDPCNYSSADVTLSQGGNWNTVDCDGDGVINGTEVTDGTNPNDPCDYLAANITLPQTGNWSSADCDGDGVPNGTEITDGTNPADPCNYLSANVSLPQSGNWNSADCDGDGVTNGTEITDGTNPNDPCSYVVADITLTQGGNWNTVDCDGDGVINGTEISGGTNPNDPCSYVIADITLTPNAGWNSLDCDGDGVTNGTEITDGTNPNDPCSSVVADITLTQGGSWNAADCDGDGVINGTEITDGTNPNDPCSYVVADVTLTQGGPWNTVDCDGDGVINGTEITGGTNPNDPCSYIAADITLTQGGNWSTADCDGDGVINGTEISDNTNPNDPCSYVTANVTLPQGGNWNTADCDGDGVTNGSEISDNTNPNDPCSYVASNVTLPQGGNWNTVDCDGDGVINGTEVSDNTNPNDPCSFVLASQTLPAGTTWNNSDCDGDGISNGNEVINGSNPLNGCDPNPCDLVIPQGFSPNGDGINDIFELKGITAYPDNHVSIFNRWGNLVYEDAGYDNTNVKWDGSNSGKLSTGTGPVPEGTYFYVIDLGDGSKVLSGYVFVNRQ